MVYIYIIFYPILSQLVSLVLGIFFILVEYIHFRLILIRYDCFFVSSQDIHHLY